MSGEIKTYELLGMKSPRKGEFIGIIRHENTTSHNRHMLMGHLKTLTGRVLSDKQLAHAVNLICEFTTVKVCLGESALGDNGIGFIPNYKEVVQALRDAGTLVKAPRPRIGAVCACGSDYQRGEQVIVKFSLVVGCPRCCTQKSVPVNQVQEFVDKHTVRTKVFSTAAAPLYAEFVERTKSHMSERAFCKTLGKMGLRRKTMGVMRYCLNIRSEDR